MLSINASLWNVIFPSSSSIMSILDITKTNKGKMSYQMQKLSADKWEVYKIENILSNINKNRYKILKNSRL